VNQLRIPPWLRVRDKAELERERAHLAALKWMEKLAQAVGYKIRLRRINETTENGK
jgi:hypothetical protein